MCKCLESRELRAVNGPGMFIRNEWARKETLIAFLSFLDRITKLMDGGSVLVVKYLGPESLLM